MTDAPERIWATVNGAADRIVLGQNGGLHSGGRQLVGGWGENPHHFGHSVEYLRADLARAQVAEAVAKALGVMSGDMAPVNTLRLKAFKTNDPSDTAAYHAAAAKWFQAHEYRVIDAINATSTAAIRAMIEETKE